MLKDGSVPTFDEKMKSFKHNNADGGRDFVRDEKVFTTVGGTNVWIIEVDGDGNCLFRAISYALAQKDPTLLRSKVLQCEQLFRPEFKGAVDQVLDEKEDMCSLLKTDKFCDMVAVMSVRCVIAMYIYENLDNLMWNTDTDKDTWEQSITQYITQGNHDINGASKVQTMEEVCTFLYLSYPLLCC